MRRWVHVQTLHLRDVKRLGRAIEECGQAIVPMGGGGSIGILYAKLTHDWAFLAQDATGRNPGALGIEKILIPRGTPMHRTMVGTRWHALKGRAVDLRWYGRGGFDSVWDYGYQGFDTSDTTLATMTLRGTSDPLPGVSHSFYSDDARSGVAWGTADWNPEHDSSSGSYDSTLTIGGAGAPDFSEWAADNLGNAHVIRDGGGTLTYCGWSVGPSAPHNTNWLMGYGEDEGQVEVFPETMPSPNSDIDGLPNYVGAEPWTMPSLDIPNGEVGLGAKIRINMQGISFANLFQMIDDGSTILEAKLRVNGAGLKRVTLTGSTAVDGSGNVDFSGWSESVTQDGISFLLIGRETVAGSTVRRYKYDVLGEGIGGTVASGKWQYVDVTALMQAYVDTNRKSKHNLFALIPAPYSGLVGAKNMKGALEGMRASFSPQIWTNPSVPVGTRPEFHLNNCPDIYYATGISASYVTWTGLSLGHVAVRWRLPDGTIHFRIVPFNMVRTD